MITDFDAEKPFKVYEVNILDKYHYIIKQQPTFFFGLIKGKWSDVLQYKGYGSSGFIVPLKFNNKSEVDAFIKSEIDKLKPPIITLVDYVNTIKKATR